MANGKDNVHKIGLPGLDGIGISQNPEGGLILQGSTLRRLWASPYRVLPMMQPDDKSRIIVQPGQQIIIEQVRNCLAESQDRGASLEVSEWIKMIRIHADILKDGLRERSVDLHFELPWIRVTTPRLSDIRANFKGQLLESREGRMTWIFELKSTDDPGPQYGKLMFFMNYLAHDEEVSAMMAF